MGDRRYDQRSLCILPVPLEHTNIDEHRHAVHVDFFEERVCVFNLRYVPCADPESFVRGCPTLTNFFLFFYLFIYFFFGFFF